MLLAGGSSQVFVAGPLRRLLNMEGRDGLKNGPRLREFLRQVETELVSNSRNEIHQTWGPFLAHPCIYDSCGIVPPLGPIPHASGSILPKSAEIYDLPLWRKFLGAPRKERAASASSVLCSLVRWSRGCEAVTLYEDEDEAYEVEPVFESEDDILRILAGWEEELSPRINGINRITQLDAKPMVGANDQQEVDVEDEVDAEEETTTSMKTSTPQLSIQQPIPLPRRIQSQPVARGEISERSPTQAHPSDPNLVISMYPDDEDEIQEEVVDTGTIHK